MTTVKFTLNEKGEIICFSLSGHSGYAEEGSDIICAAISSCVQMLEICIAEVIGESRASFKIEGDAKISFKLTENLSVNEKTAVGSMLSGFFRYMQLLGEHYKDYLSLETEVKKC